MKKSHPEKLCRLQYDKLFVNNTTYVYNNVLGQVVEEHDIRLFSQLVGKLTTFAFKTGIAWIQG